MISQNNGKSKSRFSWIVTRCNDVLGCHLSVDHAASIFRVKRARL